MYSSTTQATELPVWRIFLRKQSKLLILINRVTQNAGPQVVPLLQIA